MKRMNHILFTFTCIALLIASCQKQEEVELEKAFININLIDAPAEYDSVFVELLGVLVKTKNAYKKETDWIKVSNVKTGIYNLLEFQNGAETKLGDIYVNPGSLSQLWIILGDNNRVVANSVSHPLILLPEELSKLKLKVNSDLESGEKYNLLIDFNAKNSVIEENGNYILSPDIRAMEESTCGSIEGVITPALENTAVNFFYYTDANKAIRDTLFAYPNEDGYFLIRALPARYDNNDIIEYDVLILPPINSGFRNALFTRQIVSAGIKTNLDTIVLH